MKPARHISVSWILLWAIALGGLGCAHTAPPKTGHYGADQLQRIDSLTQALRALGPGVSEKEARGVARSAVTHATTLGRRYAVVRPPQLHNLLVKIGWKKRGLCYHWAEDLLSHLEELQLRHLQLQRVVAHRGSDLREHHSVMVTTRRKPFEEGIVLDGWRGSGELYWSPVGEDRYPWTPLDARASFEDDTDAR